MQEEPKKTYKNYNELRTDGQIIDLPPGVIDIPHTQAQQEIITSGIEMVDRKISELLGSHNKLLDETVHTPRVSFVPTDQNDPPRSGYFSPASSEIFLVLDKISDDPKAIKKYLYMNISTLSLITAETIQK